MAIGAGGANLAELRRLAQLDFDNTPATLIGTDGGGWGVLETVLDATREVEADRIPKRQGR